MGENKNYAAAKVYFDGSHYIGIPKENFPHGKGCKHSSKAVETPRQTELKAKFETAYKQSQSLPRKDRKKYIAEQMNGEFENAEQTTDYIELQTERKRNNLAKRRTVLWRKVMLQQWDYFVTFTFDSKKHTPDTFKNSLRNTLKHLAYRKQWKYIGVFERSPNKERLHFHGIFHIPENGMIGKLEQVTDYSTKKQRKQKTFQNTHFLKRFGRNDFKEICNRDVPQSVRYLLKYIEKSGERLTYGGKLPTYFISDLMGEDIVCGYGEEERKVILKDDFNCWDEGIYMGVVSPEVIAQMPKAN